MKRYGIAHEGRPSRQTLFLTQMNGFLCGRKEPLMILADYVVTCIPIKPEHVVFAGDSADTPVSVAAAGCNEPLTELLSNEPSPGN